MRQLVQDYDSGKVAQSEADDESELPEAIKEAVTEKPVEKAEAKAEAKPKEEPGAKEVKADSSLNKSDNVSKEGEAKKKAASDDERKGKTWQEINAEKESLKAEKARIEAEKAEIARLREEAQKARIEEAPLRDEHNLTAADYRKAAEEFVRKGEKDNADAAAKIAEQMDKKAEDLKRQKADEDYRSRFDKTCNELVKENPELNDASSELYKETSAVFNNPEWSHVFRAKPEGIKFAVQAAKLNLKARTFDKTESEYKALKSEYEKLQKKLSIGSGQPTSADEADESKDSSLEGMGKRLSKLVREHDRAAGFIV